MFYRYAYLMILAAITLALVLARLSYTVTLEMTRAIVPSSEISRLISILDLPEPRSITNDGRNIVLRFNPFISTQKKSQLKTLLLNLSRSPSQGNPLTFNLYLNEPELELFNYMYKVMENNRNLAFTLNTDKATMNLIPYSEGKLEKFRCNWSVQVIPPLPNFKVAQSTFSRRPEDDQRFVQIRYSLTPKFAEHHPLVPQINLTGSQTVSFLIEDALSVPPLSKNNLLLVQDLCNKALLNQGTALQDYVLFPVLASELRGATFEYDLSNNLLKL